MKKRKKAPQPLIRFAFLLYCCLMLWLLFGRSQGWVTGLTYEEMLRQNINLTPLYTIQNYLQVIIHRTNDSVLLHCIINLAGNVLLFIPIGWLLPRIWKRFRNFPLFIVTCLGLIFLVETVQLFSLLGCFDVDDIVLNLTGLILGYILTLPGNKRK